MKELLNTISELRHENDAPSKLFQSISQRLRNRYGECAIALFTSSDTQFSKVSISLFYDHLGNVCIEEQNFIDQKNCTKNCSGDFFKSFLNEFEPVKYIGEKYGFSSIFNGLFNNYIDAISFPVFHQKNIKRWFVVFFPKSNQLEGVDVERTLLVSTLIINYIESIQESKKLQEAKDWIEGELKSVANIKQQLLPQGDIKFDEINTAVLYEPYELSGGDYYDIARLTAFLNTDGSDKNEFFGIIIADASGHGTASAVEISMFDAILRTYQPDGDEGPAGVFNYANKYLFTRLIRNGFITAFVSSYQAKNHILNYANAGHPPPIIKRSGSRSVEILSDKVGIPLGISQGNQWQSSEVVINKNDIFIVYTDGITELKSTDGVQFGEQALIDIIKNSNNSLDELMADIKLALKTHQGTADNTDDLTLLMIQPRL